MIAYVLAATDEEERRGRELCARSRPCSSTSVAKTIDVEESPKGRPKRRIGGNDKDKQSKEQDIHDDFKSIESEPVPVRKSSRTTRVQTSMEVDLESGEEEGDEGYNENDDNGDDDDDDKIKNAESVSDNDDQSSDKSVESASPNKRKTKSPPRQTKKISIRKKITVPSKTKKSEQPKAAPAKESEEDVSKKTIPTPKPKPKTSAATSTALKIKTTESARRRKVEEDIDNEQSDTSVLSDESYQQQRTLINMNEVFMLNAGKLLTDCPATI